MHRLLLALLLLVAPPALAQTHLLETGWRFKRTDDSAARLPGFDDSGWQAATVPHDYAIAGPFSDDNDRQTVAITQNGEKDATEKTGRTGGLPYAGVAWYRRKLSELDNLPKGKLTYLEFDGAMSHARVYINGKFVGAHAYGYSGFEFDITKHLKKSGNTLAVRLDNKEQSSRWYPGAGIYRDVRVEIKPHLKVSKSKFTLTDTAMNGSHFIRIRTTAPKELYYKDYSYKIRIYNPYNKEFISTKLYDYKTGKEITGGCTTPQPGLFRLTASGLDCRYIFDVGGPYIWSPEKPSVYTVVISLIKGDYYSGKVVDSTTIKYGIRQTQVSKEKGFTLNGVPRKFKGVCNHHDLGPLGTAVNRAALVRQLRLLKDLGADAIRTTHNMPDPQLVELCDSMGFMLIVEAFDEWKTPKVKNGYAQDFEKNWRNDLRSMIERYRNNPSVVMWSIGNEVPDQWAEGGVALAKQMQDFCHELDPTRSVTAGMDQYDAVMKNGFAAALDVPGFNYKPHKYAEAHAKLPQGFLYGSETASTVSSRGVYHFPDTVGKNVLHPDGQSSSYDVEYCWWSQLPDWEWAAQDSLPYVTGEFVWTGFDYLGEPTPYDQKWPSHSSYFGLIDLAGLPKDRYYLYRSRWNTASPTLHLLPHWTWPGREGQTTPIYAYTSYPEAELFINGKSQGRRKKQTKGDPLDRYRLRWREVKYQPGTLRIVAYDSTGKQAAVQEVKTAGAPHHLEAVSDRTALKSDGKDLAYVTVRVVDKDGNLCPAATNIIRVQTEGPATFRAIANGDPTCLEPFQTPQMHAFSGMLVVTVQAGSRPGASQVTLTAEGLGSATVKL